MNKIFELGYSDLCLKSLIDNLGKEEHPIVQILIKHISGIYNKNVTDKTEALLPSLMEKFKELFSHSNPEMRKSVVFCLVDLSFIFEDFVELYLKDLAASQQKLVSIYIQRRLEKESKKE